MRRWAKSARERSASLTRKDKSSSKKRHRTISGAVSNSALPTSHEGEDHTHQFHLCYLGYVTVDEPRNPRDISAAVRNVMATTITRKNVTISYGQHGVLTVSEEAGDRLILCPFQHVAIVTQDTTRNSYTENSNCCIVIGFHDGRHKNQSHVFQAKSNREAADIVQALQKAFKASKGSSKSRKPSESSFTPKAKVEGHMGMRQRPLNAMEDEDELIEHKPINSARRDSKRTIPNLTRVSSEGVPSSLPSPLMDIPSPFSTQTSKKKLTRKSTSQRASEREFTRQDKADSLLSAIEKIAENNSLLREKCRVLLTPNTSFEEALVALRTGNIELLGKYLSSGIINADSADGSKNSLLHYAVAIGNIDIIRAICSNDANLEAAGWNDCRPLHRAIAEGNISVVQELLHSGAQVNGLDLMRRTPLHISSGKLELNECSILLVEQGAHIMATDVLGLRPYDLNPELKETQNRLVTSACESFVAAKLKDDVITHPSAGSLATPNSLSPTSTRPSSIASGKLESNHIDGRDLDILVKQVNLRARLIAQAHKKKMASQPPMSRSFANISELLENGDESAYRRARLEQYKFSSECGLSSEYHELEGNADLVVNRMGTLVRESKKLERKRQKQGGRGKGEEPRDQWKELDLEMSLSEPNLVSSQDSQESLDRSRMEKKILSPTQRPFSSAAVLQRHSLSHPLNKVRANSGASQSSAGTLIEDSEEEMDDGDVEIKRVSLELDVLRRDTTDKVAMLEQVSSRGRTTRQQRNSIFDELISQLNEVREELDHPLSPSSDRRSSSVEGVASNSIDKQSSQEPVDSVEMIDTINLEDISETVDLDEIIDAIDSDSGSGRPVSTVSEQMDMFSSLPRPALGQHAITRTESLSSATLPNNKKSRSKWLHRVGSPLLRSRRSFTKGSSSSKHQSSKVKEMKKAEGGERAGSVEAGEEKGVNQAATAEGNKKKERGSRRLFARKQSLPEIHDTSLISTPLIQPTFQRTTSSDNVPQNQSETCVTGFGSKTNQSNQLLPKQSPILYRPIAQAPPTGRTGSRQGDPVTTSLEQMVTLSRNNECLSTLVSYICMPKCGTRLRQLSQDVLTSPEVLKNIATLMTNIFEAGGTSEGKKTALKSGVLDLTIKLLQGRDPIPGTCLSLLNGLLVSEDDSDFLRTIIRIPSKPLLQYLEPVMGDVVSESDSGYSNLKLDTLVSASARSGSDASNPVTQDEGPSSDAGVSKVRPARLEVPVSALRTSSINSEFSESSFNGRSLASPTLQGSSVTSLEARRIVLKMLAVSSTHSKMQNELSNERALSLLADVCSDPSHENLTNGLITLANVAQNVASHELFFKLGLVDKFHSSLVHGPHPRYHASRALVYLGKLEMLQGISLFKPIATGYETDVMIQTTDSDGHEYARGATIEKCAEMLTSKLSLLWGGFSLAVGPLSPSTEKIPPKATKEQIIDFFLTMCKSFVHPLIFVRLLRHRLAHPDPENLFDWSTEMKSGSPSAKTTPTSSIPPEQLNLFKVIGRWMEAYPEDFVKYPSLQSEVEAIVTRLRPVRGSYLPHTHRLKSLLQDINRPPGETAVAGSAEEKREPHHENLYKLCQKMVTGGHLPITSEEALYLGSLQMHIEELALRSKAGGNTGSLTKGRKATSRIKNAFPPGYTKSKQLIKRIQNQILEFEKLSDRNSKHLYIERCQGNPGYACTFFSVRVPTGGKFKKSGVSKQLLGISSKKVVFLNEKTKELLLMHPLASVLNVTREPESPTLIFTFRGDMTEFKVQVESNAHAWEMVNVLEQCKGDRLSTEEAVRWSESLPSLFTMSVEQRLGDNQDSLSGESSNEMTDERVATPSGGPVLSNDALRSSLDPDYAHLEPTSSNGLLDSTPSRKRSQCDMLRKESSDDVPLVEEKAVFCDCPPDPELPRGFNLKLIVLTEMLSCPLEVARQMTLIAHERFCAITAVDLLEKVNVIPKRSSKVVVQRDSHLSNHSGQSLSLSFSDVEQQETSIEKVAFRFNQVGNWVANCILTFETVEERAGIIDRFISIAKHCFDFRNYGSMMAIVVAGLGSAPIRRLHQSWALVPKERRDLFREIDAILDSKSNYKRYRESLELAPTPCVPYLGVILKDLTFICDGNPDYLRGGLINLHKRRQVYKKLQEVDHFQQEHYKLHRVPELSQYLLSHHLVAEDDLHCLSQTLEPRIKRSQSQTNARLSSTGSQKSSFFKSISGRSSSSASNLNKVS